jgi:hypothetical protein
MLGYKPMDNTQAANLEQSPEHPYNRGGMVGKPKAPELRKTLMLRIRVTDEQRRILERAASAAGLELGSWVRLVSLAQARRLLRTAKPDES